MNVAILNERKKSNKLFLIIHFMSLNFKCFVQSKVTQEFGVYSNRKPIFDLWPNIVPKLYY